MRSRICTSSTPPMPAPKPMKNLRSRWAKTARWASLIAMPDRKRPTGKRQAGTRYMETKEGGYRPAETPSIPASMNGPQIRPITPTSAKRPAPGTPGSSNSQS